MNKTLKNMLMNVMNIVDSVDTALGGNGVFVKNELKGIAHPQIVHEMNVNTGEVSTRVGNVIIVGSNPQEVFEAQRAQTKYTFFE